MAAPLIETHLGKLRGVVEDNITGGTFVAFKGIPYAVPPVGDLRFRDPIPIEPWTEIRDATKFGEICCQYDTAEQRFIGSEDCLYLNVYVPSLDPSELRAVIVFIHGGGFKTGSGNDDVHGVDYLIKKNIVIVTLNYRLGCLGFLNLGDRAAPGNQGLKDQVLALKWVNENIRKFGGDPDNVTIVGHSVGSGCAHQLTLSSMGRGLFHKVILQSAVTLCFFYSPCPVQVGKRLGTVLGRTISDPQDLVDYLRTVEIVKLMEAQRQVLTPEERATFAFPFHPAPDPASDNPFFPVPDKEAVKLGIQVPCIIGHTSREGLFMQADFETAGRDAVKIMPVVIQKYHEDQNLQIHKIVKHYLGEDENDDGIVSKLVDFTTGVVFNAGIHVVLGIQTKVSNFPTFYYKFSFDSGKTWMKTDPRINLPGTCHGDDLSFLFHHRVMDKLGKKPLYLDEVHNRIIQRFVEMWTNFAKTGNPTPRTSELIPVIWEPIDNTECNEYKCLQISDTLTMGSEEDHYQSLAQKIEMFQ